MADGDKQLPLGATPREQMPSTSISQGQIARIVQGFREVVARTGNAATRWAMSGAKDRTSHGIDGPVNTQLSHVDDSTFMGPGQPLVPSHQETAGRQWDYPFAVNINWMPRGEQGENQISFAQLRGLADGYDLLRLAIETRKDQIQSFSYEIGPVDEKDQTDYTADIKYVQGFFKRPDKEHDFKTWLRMGMEEVLTIDSWCIYPRFTMGGELYSLELVDGATIKRIIDEDGRTPIPPDPAYQQVIKGLPTADFSKEDLLYLMRNPRVSRIYGLSPTEQVIMTVNIALRRQLHQLAYYTEGNVPEAIAGVPETWTAEQIRQFQLYWDSLMEGNLGQRRHMKFIPKMDGIVFPKEALLKDEFDEWLARIICYCFSLPPIALIRQVNRASGEQMANTAKEEGLTPWLEWIADQFTYIIQHYMGFPHLKFNWRLKDISDPAVKATVLTSYVSAGIITDDEAREELGRPPLTDEQRAAMGMGDPMMGDGAIDPATGETVSEGVVQAFRDVAGSPQGAAASGGAPSVDRITQAFRTTKMRALTRGLRVIKGAAPTAVHVHLPENMVRTGDQFIRVQAPEAPDVHNHLDVREEVGKQLQKGMRTEVRKTVKGRREADGTFTAEITETQAHRKEAVS